MLKLKKRNNDVRRGIMESKKSVARILSIIIIIAVLLSSGYFINKSRMSRLPHGTLRFGLLFQMTWRSFLMKAGF